MINKIFNKQNISCFLFVSAIGIMFLVGNANAHLVSTLGVSSYAAKKIINIISTASTIWSIIGIVGAIIGSGGIGVGVLFTAKALIKKYGKKYAAAW